MRVGPGWLLAKVTPLKTSVNSGEFSQYMAARSDFALYANGAKFLENFILLPQGGATRRGGTRFIGAAKTNLVKLIEYERSAEQAYVLEVGQGYIRIFTRQAQILDVDDDPLEIDTPYTDGGFDPFQLDVAQDADVLVFVHPDYPPHKLTRIDESTWTFTKISFKWGPLGEENDTDTTLLASGTSGSITLTASAPIFHLVHAGSIWGLGPASGVLGHPGWAPGLTVANNDYLQFEGRVYRVTGGGGTTGRIAPSHDTGIVSDGGVDLRFVQWGFYGLVRIEEVNTTTSADATVIQGELREGNTTTPTTYWREGSWSGWRGYPRSITFLDGRAWYGGTKAEPQSFWGSAVEKLNHFRLQGSVPDDPTTDDGMVQGELRSKQISQILWMMSRDGVIIGTSAGPWKLDSSDQGPITPRNRKARKQSSRRCSDIAALEINSSLMFVPRDRRHLDDLRFDLNFDNLESVDQTLLSSHILEPGVKQIAYQAVPFSTLWALRDDGQLAAYAFNRSEEIRGWARQKIGGADAKVISVAVIPGAKATGSDDRDEVWIAVQRTIDGETVTYIEMFEDIHRASKNHHGAWHLDSALRLVSETPFTTISGLGHLEGETVSAWTDSGVLESRKVVTDGAIPLDNPANSAIVGLDCPYVYVPLPFDVGSATGTARTKLQSYNEVRLILYLTSAGIKASQDGGALSSLYDVKRGKFKTDPCERLAEDEAEIFAFKPRDGKIGYDTTMRIESDLPGPCTILGISPHLRTEDEG